MGEDEKPPSRRSNTDLWNRTIDTGEPPNVLIGADGNSLLPGDAAKERKRRGNTRRYKGFPKVAGNTSGYDRERIKSEYFDSPITEWDAYCATRGYNPEVRGLPYKSWVREKKYKQAWAAVSKEIEEAGTELGPKNLLRSLQAVKDVPETLAGMLQICRHAVQIHYSEALSDTKRANEARLKGEPPPQRTFSLDAMGVACLTTAVTKTSEALYKALGIDMSVGVSPHKWMQMVEDNLSEMDGSQAARTEEETMGLTIIGAKDARAAMKDAIDKYLDKPRQVEALEADEVPAPIPSEDPEVLEAEEDAL